MVPANINVKLKLLKAPIQRWNKEVFGNIDQELQCCENKLSALKRVGECRDLNSEELNQITDLRSQRHLCRVRKTQLYSQYSRVRNLTLKDHNTKYFHVVASVNRRRNQLLRVKVNKVDLMQNIDIRNGVTNYFKGSFRQEEVPDISLPPNAFRRFDPNVATKY